MSLRNPTNHPVSSKARPSCKEAGFFFVPAILPAQTLCLQGVCNLPKFA